MALIEIATYASHGAPTPSQLQALGPVGEPRRSQASALDAVVKPVAEADEPRLLALLALLGAMTLAAFAFAARQQRG